MNENKKDDVNIRFLDLFMKQSDFFWKFQQTVILIETAVFAGWYKTYKDGEQSLSMWILLIGIIVHVILFLIILRASQYLNALRQSALKALPKDLESPFMHVKSSYIGVATPIICIVFNIGLLLLRSMVI